MYNTDARTLCSEAEFFWHEVSKTNSDHFLHLEKRRHSKNIAKLKDEEGGKLSEPSDIKTRALQVFTYLAQ